MFFFYLYLTLVEGLTGLMDTLKELTEENKVKSMEIGTLQGRFNEQTSQLREYKDRYAEYKRLGEQLTTDIEAVSNENALLKESLVEKESSLRVEMSRLEALLTKKNSEIERQCDGVKSATSLYEALKEENTKVIELHQIARDERDKILKEYMDYRKEITENKAEVDTSMAVRLQELHAELSTLESSYSEEVLSFKASNNKLEIELDRARSSTATLEASIVAKSASMKKMELERNNALAQITAMESREKELSTLVMSLTAETGQLQGQNEELQGQLDQAYKRQEQVDSAVKSLDVELKKQLQQVEEERNSLTSQLTSANKQIDVHISTIDLLKADRPALTTTVSKLQEEISAARIRMELLSKENKERNDQLHEQGAQMKSLKEELDMEKSANAVFQDMHQDASKAKEEVLILKGTIKELQTQLNLSEQENITLSLEVSTLKEQRTEINIQENLAASEKIKDENTILNDTVDELLCSNNDLKVSLSTMQERCEGLTSDLDASRMEVKELEEAKNTLDNTLLSMQNELGNLSTAMEGLVDVHELDDERNRSQVAMQTLMQEKEAASSQLAQSQADLEKAQDLIFELSSRLEANMVMSSPVNSRRDEIKTVASEDMRVQQLQSTITELEGRIVARSRAEKQAIEVEKSLRDEIDALAQAGADSTEKLQEAQRTIMQLKTSLADMKEGESKYRRVVADLQRAVIEYESQMSHRGGEEDNIDSSRDDKDNSVEIEAAFQLNAEEEKENAQFEAEEAETNLLLALEQIQEQQACAAYIKDDYKDSWECLYGLVTSTSSPSFSSNKVQFDLLVSRFSVLQAEMSSKQEECSKKDDMLQRAQTLMMQLKEDSSDKDALLAELKAELHAKEEECECLQVEVASKDGACSHSKQQVMKLSADVDDMNELLTKVQLANNTSVTSFESKLEDMTEAHKKLTRENDELQLIISRSEEAQAILRSTVDEQQASIQSKQREMDNLQLANDEILSAMDMVSKALTEAQAREDEYAQTTSKLQLEISSLQQKLAEARGSNSDVFLSLEEKLRTATEQLVTAKSRVIHVEEQLAEKSHELMSLRQHFKTLQYSAMPIGSSTDIKLSEDVSGDGVVGLEDEDEVLRGSVDSLDSIILTEIMGENARITRNCIDSMIRRREMRYMYTAFLALKRCSGVDDEVEEEEEEMLQGEVFVEQDSCASDIFNISADSTGIECCLED